MSAPLPTGRPLWQIGVLALAVLSAPCSARAMPSSYGSSIFHVSSSVPSSHQSVTLSEERTVHHVPHHMPHALERSHDHAHEHDPAAPYKFEYKVHDQKNHNYHERAESSDGQVVRGFYSLLEPHGEVRVVKYRADHDGFQSEVSRHGSRHTESHGGGLGATIGSGPAHDLGSHGLGVSASAPITAEYAPVITVSALVKHSIPIHEEAQEDNSGQWSAIEDPKKGSSVVKGHGLEEVPAPSKEALGKPPGGRIPEQILLQQQKKKKASFQALQHSKPPPHLHNKFLKRPSPLPFGPRPGGPGGPRPYPPHFHRGPKRGPSPGPGPRPRSAHVGPPAPAVGPGPAPGPPPSPQRREARPPPTPCKCSEQPPGHAPHAPHGRKLT